MAISAGSKLAPGLEARFGVPFVFNGLVVSRAS
jgi:hypothetical protein